MPASATANPAETLRALPGDDVRQILWRFADRYDLQMLVQSVRSVARGPVARLVAARRSQHARVDPREGATPQRIRQRRHHHRLHGPRVRRLHRRSQEPRARPGRLRNRLGRRRAPPPAAWPRTWLSAPSTSAAPRSRRPNTWAPACLRHPAKIASTARRLLPHRTPPLRRRRDRPALRQACASPSGRKAKSRCSK